MTAAVSPRERVGLSIVSAMADWSGQGNQQADLLPLLHLGRELVDPLTGLARCL